MKGRPLGQRACAKTMVHGFVGRRSRGQALLEFVVMLAMMMSIVFAMALFLAVFTEYGWRILSLVSLEYP